MAQDCSQATRVRSSSSCLALFNHLSALTVAPHTHTHTHWAAVSFFISHRIYIAIETSTSTSTSTCMYRSLYVCSWCLSQGQLRLGLERHTHIHIHTHSCNLISLLYNLAFPQHKCCVISKDMPTIQRQPQTKGQREKGAGAGAAERGGGANGSARNPLLTLLICHFNKFIL